MGKAGKWIINLLLGKREEKSKRKDIVFYEENVATPTSSAPPTPTHKRRWSFRKPGSKVRNRSNSPKSFDSLTTIITSRPSLRNDNKQDYTRQLALANSLPLNRGDRQSIYAQFNIRKTVADAAATRIQAAFRSHLARKALRALRGLVKIQALARGHLVRKQTTATLLRMHALMAIQVRARMQRIQMADEPQSQLQLGIKSQSSRHRNIHLDKKLRARNHEINDSNLFEANEVLKQRQGYLNQSHFERIKKETKSSYSGELQISKRKHLFEELTTTTAQNSPQIDPATPRRVPGRASFTCEHPNSPQIDPATPRTVPGIASFTCEHPNYLHPISHPFPFVPTYMGTTESSKAKARSQSEPKERPGWSMRRKNKQTASVNGMSIQQGVQVQSLSSQMEHVVHTNNDLWFINL